MNWGAAATAVVGVTGIAGTFFAPYWGQSKLEGRRARSSFRKARRLVLDEVASLIAQLDLMLKAQRAPDDSTTALETPRWTQHAETLADYLEEGHGRPSATSSRRPRFS